MADKSMLAFNTPHPPHANAIEAFTIILPKIKSEIIASRKHWDHHEPKMWSRAKGISNSDLTDFDLKKDLVLVSSASTSYGTIILGKIRIPAINDEEGEGFIHVRIHDPPNRGVGDVMFHSLFTDEGNKVNDHPTTWRAIQTSATPLEFFNE